MIQPNEMKLNLPMELSNGVVSTTTDVWDILNASRDGNVARVRELVNKCPELIYAQYNYTPPIHFAVREGHLDLVNYLLSHGAHDPDYKTYAFHESLFTIAQDREYNEIALLLERYANNLTIHKYKGDNGKIDFLRSALEQEFENVVDKEELKRIEKILKENNGLLHNDTFFWGEGILTIPAKKCNREVLALLMRYGAKVPDILKWTQFYYFERFDTAVFLLENGMNPNVMSWHQVTILHDMAQKGDIPKAELLIKYGADIDALEDEYHSTPLGLAAKWGQTEMVEFLLGKGANPAKAGASWATPLAWAKKKGYFEIEDILLKKVRNGPD